jgi:hypothetical protein
MIEQILKVLREKAYEKQPSVNELKVLDGLGAITAADRNEAWKQYQSEQEKEQKAETDTNVIASETTQSSEADANTGAGEAAKADAETVIANEVTQSEQATTTTTATTTETESNDIDAVEFEIIGQPHTHRVTVKRDGFRRCGRAWQGTTELVLSDEEAEILTADSMFVVETL